MTDKTKLNSEMEKAVTLIYTAFDNLERQAQIDFIIDICDKLYNKGRQDMRDAMIAYIEEKWIHQVPACVTKDLKDKFGDNK